jgi:DNA helicase-2/ATP-dependent DNA helicase PcrA
MMPAQTFNNCVDVTYYHMYNSRFWSDAASELSLPDDINKQINQYMNKNHTLSKHKAVENCIQLFNRFSEEELDPVRIVKSSCDAELKLMAKIYSYYLKSLHTGNRRHVDFSLLQQEGHKILMENPSSAWVFKHVIIDEYQDTNSIQEKIFFSLAAGHGNIAVVGDDDQALYRFRGATVENFVCFPDRCQTELGCSVSKIPLSTNYRSRKRIVDFYRRFIDQENWTKNAGNKTYYRIVDKNITAFSTDELPSVVVAGPGKSLDVCEEIADFVAKLISKKKVADPNQVAFLYRTLGSEHAKRMIDALERRGLKVYAPRAKRFLDNHEPAAIIGLFLKIFGKPYRDPRYDMGGNREFHNWLDKCDDAANGLLLNDRNLVHFVGERIAEVKAAVEDYRILITLFQDEGWQLSDEYEPKVHNHLLRSAAGLSDRARKDLASKGLDYALQKRSSEGKTSPLSWVLGRATSLDWNVLDLFYRFCGFKHFKKMFDLAETGTDEGPICNLAMTSQYLARFIDNYYGIIGGSSLTDGKFVRIFFITFLGALFRRGETEYEDAENIFPKGRIPFLTIHQSKGLEFPVVVLGNPDRGHLKPQRVEEIVRPFLSGDYEPLDRVAAFDTMRMYYVALSRAQNLLILAHLKVPGTSMHPCFKNLMEEKDLPRLSELKLSTLPAADEKNNDISRMYSYTSDYLAYRDCPRRYMVFKKYGFAPSRSTTMFFGSLVHQTIEDLHHYLIQSRKGSS